VTILLYERFPEFFINSFYTYLLNAWGYQKSLCEGLLILKISSIQSRASGSINVKIKTNLTNFIVYCFDRGDNNITMQELIVFCEEEVLSKIEY